MMAKKKTKRPRPHRADKPIRKPDVLPGSDNSADRVCWRFTYVDHEGPWGFDKVDGETLCWIMRRLAEFESMTINEIFNNRDYPGKDYEVARIPHALARQRLEECGRGDMTKIWCLRLGGEERLYGFLCENVFHVVFWDPKHEIWPSPKKGT